MNREFKCGSFASDLKGVSEYSFNGNIAEYYAPNPVDPIYDQGSTGACVSYALHECLGGIYRFKNKKTDIPVDYLYKKRQDKSVDGMSPREGLDILVKENKINNYAQVRNLVFLKAAIIINGGALLALPVYDFSNTFWKEKNEFIGGHAVAAVGYDKDNIVIKNSWGTEYGNSGLINIPIEDITRYCLEAWTIIN